MEKPFAKLFGTDANQILVKVDTDDEGKPELRVYFQPEGLGVCSMAMSWNDNDEGFDLADAAFEKMDEAKARAIAEKQIRFIKEQVTTT